MTAAALACTAPNVHAAGADGGGGALGGWRHRGLTNATGYTFDAAARERDVITATLTLVLNENTPNERRETMIVPLRKIGDLMLVKSERL